MTATTRRIHEALEADRWTCDQAGRETSELDPRAVLIAIEVKLSEGRIDEARALANEYRASKKGE